MTVGEIWEQVWSDDASEAMSAAMDAVDGPGHGRMGTGAMKMNEDEDGSLVGGRITWMIARMTHRSGKWQDQDGGCGC